MGKSKSIKKPEPPVDAPADAAAEVIEIPAVRHDGARFMVTLSREATKLLDTACLVDGRDRSATIEDLIVRDLACYYAGKTVPSVIENAEV